VPGVLPSQSASTMSQHGVLKSLDTARTQMYHFTAILIAGMGFFTDAYDLFWYAMVPCRCASSAPAPVGPKTRCLAEPSWLALVWLLCGSCGLLLVRGASLQERDAPLPWTPWCHSISGVTKLLGRLYYYDPASGKPGTLPANVDASISAVALIGTLAGQVGRPCLHGGL